MKSKSKTWIPQPNEIVRYKGMEAVCKSVNIGGKCVIKIDKATRVITIKDIDISEIKPLN